MTVQWYCTQGCPSPNECKYPKSQQICIYCYDARYNPKFAWQGEGNPPPKWTVGNTTVYRSYADYCED